MIHRLDPMTISKIAAGEVIERPAAVVKELLENALDAQARAVHIEVAGGGQDLIRVTDDGIGMHAADLPLAVERYTTSKLQAFHDLTRLTTYGFRGEALASIAAVSELEILSRPSAEPVGHRIRVRFGKTTTVEPAPAAPGTAVTVRDLFANVPVRRRFLRNERTETAFIQRVVAAYALARPDVQFTLVIDGRMVFSTDGSGQLRNAMASVLGADVAEQMILLEWPAEPDATHRVAGAISLPSLFRSNRQQMLFFVNHRWIESRTLSVAVEQAYHSLLLIGRYPIVVLTIHLPPEHVDVNVHPTKREVRFHDERRVFHLLHDAVRHTLQQWTAKQAIPPVEFRTAPPLATPPPEMQRRLLIADPRRVGTLDTPPQPVAPIHTEQQTTERERLPLLRVLGQVQQTYIIAEGPDGLYLIDQHAAHERVLLERLLAQWAAGRVEAQTLLEPYIVELTADQLAMFEAYQDELAALGFQLEPFGGNAVAIRQVPAILRQRSPNTALLAILDDLSNGGHASNRIESLAMTTACHSAIRAGQVLSLEEMRALIQELEQCTAPRACAHGRPTMVHLSNEELARQFARR